jgi:dihydrodipicolinate synthase/N-acetylneuraminate lyase
VVSRLDVTSKDSGLPSEPVDLALDRIRGVSPVLATPFTPQGALDRRGYERVVNHVLASGVSSLLVFGLAGESYKLDEDERRELLRTLVEQARGFDLTIIASVADHATEVAVRRAQEWLASGANAINVLPPSFLNPSAESIETHLETVIEAVEAPVICQLAPNETGLTLEPSALARLAKSHPNFRLVKVESQPPGETIAALLNESDGQLKSIVGYAGLTWPDAVHAGAIGVQPSCSFTELYVQAQAALDSGDEPGLEQMHGQLLPFLTDWMTSVERLIAIDKAILWRRGLIESPTCRHPNASLTKSEFARVDEFLALFEAEMR